MSDVKSPVAKTGEDKPSESGGQGPSHGSRGTTTIADSVVMKIARLAAQEIDEVVSLGEGVSGAVSGVVGKIRGDEHVTAGVDVEVGRKQTAIDLSMTVRYPAAIHEVADAVRQNVIDRIESMTGLQVVEVNIAVSDLAFDGAEDQGPDRVQ